MHPNVARLSARAPHSEILVHPRWRDLHALPVVDDDGTFVGALRYRTLRRLEEEAAAEQKRRHPVTLALGLSELYWTGLQRLVALAGSALTTEREHQAPPDETHGDWVVSNGS